MEPVTRSAYGYAGNNPINFTDPSGLYRIPIHLPSLGDLWHGFADQVGCGFQQLGNTFERGVDLVQEHAVGILKLGGLGLGVAAIFATGPVAPLLFALGGLALNVAAEAVSTAPCRSERITQTLAIGGVFSALGVLWTGASQAATMADDVGSAAAAESIGSVFGIGDVATALVPNGCRA